jgi:putative peptidoglycan lipid II flippase
MSKSFLKKSYGISAAIIICRILGLAREILLAGIFGGGALMSAWGLAFMTPNLLRRLFGEGALGTSIVPIVTYAIEEEGAEKTRKKLGAIYLTLSVILMLIVILFSVAAILCEPFAKVERVKLALELIPLLMPYAFFICIIGAMSSVLNSVGRFFWPAIGTLSLNIVMVLCLLFVCPLFAGKTTMLKALALSVVLSGVIQLVFTSILLKAAGMFPELRISQFWKEPAVKELWQLTLPAMIGASALQISFVVDRTMACWLGDYAVPALNYSDRIIDIPIGIFAVAMAAVVMPALSKSAARKNDDEHSEQFISSLKSIFFLSIPSAIFIFIFSIPIVRLFYMRGAFGEKELAETVWAMKFYTAGIPFFCSVKIINSAFQSRKDMKTPVKVSILCIILNILLNYLLMFKLRQGGIALATVISSFANCLILLLILKARNPERKYAPLIIEFFKLLVSSSSAAVCAFFIYHLHSGKLSLNISVLPPDLLPLLSAAASFAIVFLLASSLTGSKESAMILQALSVKKIFKAGSAHNPEK